jgi:hypothetical protein
MRVSIPQQIILKLVQNWLDVSQVFFIFTVRSTSYSFTYFIRTVHMDQITNRLQS